MNYTVDEIMQYVEEEDVKFIRLAFCDVFGRQKNISIMPSELERAFEQGIAFDASAVRGFGNEAGSDLLLFPDPDTLSVLPWRPEHGRVVRMYCSIKKPNGKTFECDTRSLLINAAAEAQSRGIGLTIAPELEFYLFKLDENGEPTAVPYDNAGYMDIAPLDKGENIRRRICLTLEQMGITPKTSHHEQGPGQNKIDFGCSDPLNAADNVMSFITVVKTVAHSNGLCADFSPKPISDRPGSGFHISLSFGGDTDGMLLKSASAGILEHIGAMTRFLDPSAASYTRFGSYKAPRYISWSYENGPQLMRISTAADGGYTAELRSPDPLANPYLAFTLLIYAALDGIDKKLILPDNTAAKPTPLPADLNEADRSALESSFISSRLPSRIVDIYCK